MRISLGVAGHCTPLNPNDNVDETRFALLRNSPKRSNHSGFGWIDISVKRITKITKKKKPGVLDEGNIISCETYFFPNFSIQPDERIDSCEQIPKRRVKRSCRGIVSASQGPFRPRCDVYISLSTTFLFLSRLLHTLPLSAAGRCKSSEMNFCLLRQPRQLQRSETLTMLACFHGTDAEAMLKINHLTFRSRQRHEFVAFINVCNFLLFSPAPPVQ